MFHTIGAPPRTGRKIFAIIGSTAKSRKALSVSVAAKSTAKSGECRVASTVEFYAYFYAHFSSCKLADEEVSTPVQFFARLILRADHRLNFSPATMREPETPMRTGATAYCWVISAMVSWKTI